MHTFKINRRKSRGTVVPTII